MADTSKVTTIAEFLELIEASDALKADELQVARELAKEARDTKMLARRLMAKHILTRWQAGQLLSGWNKFRMGNYRLRSQIARGNLGRVFLAEHIQLGRDVAIKTLSRRFQAQTEIVDQFLEDSREVAALDHRNILHVLDIDSAQGQYYMVLEFVDGRDLRRIIDEEGPLPPRVVADYVRQTAEGLAYAHKLKVAHGDLRPDNLMVDANGVVKILGFGVARLADYDRNERAGKKADEVADDQPIQVRHNRDIRTLGGVARFLLTGREAGEDEPDQDPSSDTGAATIGNVPKELDAIFQRMESEDAGQNFASAGELEQTLSKWIDRDRGVPGRGRRAFPEISGMDAPDTAGSRSDAGGVGDEDGVEEKTSQKFRWVLASVGALVVISAIVAYAIWPEGKTTLADATPPDPKPEARTPSKPLINLNRNRTNDAHPLSKAPDETDPSAEASGSNGDGNGNSDEVSKPSETEKTPTDPPPKTDVPEKKDPPEPKTEPKAKVDPKPEEKAKPVPPPNPLRQLAEAVDLPKLDADTLEKDLGAVELTNNALRLTLLGADKATDDGTQFELVPFIDRGPNAWRIKMINRESDTRLDEMIAQLAEKEGRLVFQWEEAARDEPTALHLVNCVLRVQVGIHTHNMRLRTPLLADPFTVTMKRSTLAERWKLDAVPDPSIVKLQILSLDEPFPEVFKPEPAVPVAADGGKIKVLIGEERVLQLDLEGDLKQVFRLKCSSYFILVPREEPIVMSGKMLQNAKIMVNKNLLYATEAARRAREANAKVPRNAPEKLKRQFNNQQKLADAQQEKAAAAFERFKTISQLVEKLTDGGNLQFRLFFSAGNCEVELLRTRTKPSDPPQ